MHSLSLSMIFYFKKTLLIINMKRFIQRSQVHYFFILAYQSMETSPCIFPRIISNTFIYSLIIISRINSKSHIWMTNIIYSRTFFNFFCLEYIFLKKFLWVLSFAFRNWFSIARQIRRSIVFDFIISTRSYIILFCLCVLFGAIFILKIYQFWISFL